MDAQEIALRNTERIATLTANFQPLVTELLEQLNNVFFETPLITDANRTLAEQKELYAQGRSKSGKIVTWTLNSNHIGGRAVDIGFITKEGKLTYDIDWEKFGRVVRGIPGLEWGYDLWKIDKPHVQYNPDKEVPHWSKEAMDWAVKLEIISQEHDPDAKVTWGELVVVLQNYHNKYGKKT